LTKVTLKFTGLVWARTQVYRMDFAFEGKALRDLLEALFARHDLRDLVLDGKGQFIPRSGVLVNGRSSRFLGDLNAPIRDGDEVIVMRPSIGAI
jgi:molybdopterin converting factor small subunit